jgi:hypothetical protein
MVVEEQVTRLLAVPQVADWTIGRDLADRIALPDYRDASAAGDATVTSPGRPSEL